MKLSAVTKGVNYSIITTDNGEKLGYLMLGHTDPAKNPKAKQESSRYSFVINWQGTPDEASPAQRQMVKRLLAAVTDTATVAERARAETRKDKIAAAMVAQGLDSDTIAAILKAA